MLSRAVNEQWRGSCSAPWVQGKRSLKLPRFCLLWISNAKWQWNSKQYYHTVTAWHRNVHLWLSFTSGKVASQRRQVNANLVAWYVTDMLMRCAPAGESLHILVPTLPNRTECVQKDAKNHGVLHKCYYHYNFIYSLSFFHNHIALKISFLH